MYKKPTAQSPKLKAIILLAVLFLAAIAQAEVVDKIVVVVNNEIITQADIDRSLEPVYEQYRALYYGDELVRKLEEMRQKIIEQEIEDKLILSEAKKLNVPVDESEVDAKLEEVKKRFPTNEEFERALASQYMSTKELRQRYREQIMVRRLIDQKIGSQVAVSPVEMDAYYNAHINEFVEPDQIRLRNILIRPKEGLDVHKALDMARDLVKKLKEGGDFAMLASEYSEGPNASDGGLMGYVKKGDLLPEIERIVFNMKEGEISDVIQTGVGYHIFKVEEKRERRTKTFAEVRRDVEELIFREKVKDKLKGWMEGLRKNAYIAFK